MTALLSFNGIDGLLCGFAAKQSINSLAKTETLVILSVTN